MTDRGELTTTRAALVAEYLDGLGVAYEIVEHEATVSALGEARVAHLPPWQVAKTVVLHDGDAYVIAVIPASERLDLGKLREVLSSSRQLRLASEDEIAREFPQLDVGAVPPFGPMAPTAEVIDRGLLEVERVLCAAGDHRHSLLVDPREIVRITSARTADICED